MKQLTALLAALMWIGAAQATTINNGSFEAGNLNGWGTDPLVRIRTVTGPAGNPQSPTDGDFMAQLIPRSPQNDDDQECSDFDSNLFDCAYMYQFLTIHQYDTINFDWNFRDREPSSRDPDYPDPALYFIGTFGANSGVQELANAATMGRGWTGWNTSSYWHGGETAYGVIAFAIANWEDGRNDSQLLIDNVRVPEPGSLALLAMGLLGLGFSRKRAA